MGRTGSQRRAAGLLIGPATLLLLAIFVYPFVYALCISFTEWTLGQQLSPTWTGFANYVSLVGDRRFLNAIYRSGLFVTGAVSIELVLGFALALLFNKHLPGFGFFRTLAVLPVMVMPVATGLVWFYVLNFQYGPLNVLLRALHLPVQNWLPHPTWAHGRADPRGRLAVDALRHDRAGRRAAQPARIRLRGRRARRSGAASRPSSRSPCRCCARSS